MPDPGVTRLVRDESKAYDSVLDARTQAGRIAAICLVERGLANMKTDQRLSMRQTMAKPLWDELHAWLKLVRLPTQLNSGIEELPPHRWKPQG